MKDLYDNLYITMLNKYAYYLSHVILIKKWMIIEETGSRVIGEISSGNACVDKFAYP